MKISIKLGVAFLALAAGVTTCTTVASRPGNGRVYLVGVAGGG